MADFLQVNGINSRGYGIIPKQVMQDKRLTVIAKSIYSYFCTYAGAGDTAFPSRYKILLDLNISKDSFYKHFNLLKRYGYITVCQEKNAKGRFVRNVYTLVESVPCPEIPDTAPCPELPYPDKPNTAVSIKSNKKKNNSSSSSTAAEIVEFWKENGFGVLPGKVQSEINAYLAGGIEPALVVAVLGECVNHNARKWAYADRILSRLKAEGTMTAESYKAAKMHTSGYHWPCKRIAPENDLLARFDYTPMKRKE